MRHKATHFVHIVRGVLAILVVALFLSPALGFAHSSHSGEGMSKPQCGDFPGAYEVSVDLVSIPKYQDKSTWEFFVRFRTEQHFYNFYTARGGNKIALMVARAEQNNTMFYHVVWEQNDSLLSVRLADGDSELSPASPICVNPIKYNMYNDTRYDLTDLLNVFLEKGIARDIRWYE